MKMYICDICKKEHSDIGEYAKCVSRCAKMAEDKYADAAYQKLKDAKTAYEKELESFKQNYPKKYDEIYGNDEDAPVSENETSNQDVKRYVEISRDKDGVKARVDGKEVTGSELDNLLKNSELGYFGQILKLLGGF